MRVISMVPSLTETLLEAGVNVVGRTRYCIHPQGLMAGIPEVGGTKDINWNLVKSLKPDLLILDQEENPERFSQEQGLAWFATHVKDHASLATNLDQLGDLLNNSQLKIWGELAGRLSKVRCGHFSWGHLPGLLELWKNEIKGPQQAVYVIWKKPWMRVSSETFIGSTMKILGLPLVRDGITNYPEFQFTDFDADKSFFLFSSEPYPFQKQRPDLTALRGAALVDGESYSWFGIRNLRFLENYLKSQGQSY